jgi:hypothetical protein
MVKLSSAGVIKDAIAKLPEGTFLTLAELHAAVEAAGISKSEAQVYADVQSLASRRAISRGPEPRTYGQLDGDYVAPVKTEADGTPKVRKLRVGNNRAGFTTAEVLTGIEAELGPSIPRNKTDSAYCAVLLGDWDAGFLLSRAQLVLQSKPVSWFQYSVQENVAVGFYK